MKECTTCNEEKELTDFYYRKDSGKHKNECKECTVKRSKKNRKEDADQYDRARHLMLTYGLTLEDYDLLLEEQGGCCAICGTDKPTGKGRFHVDHDHNTNEIRGLLCSQCNQAIGLLKDSSKNCLLAASYLKQFNR